jgi:hypothetical protein
MTLPGRLWAALLARPLAVWRVGHIKLERRVGHIKLERITVMLCFER